MLPPAALTSCSVIFRLSLITIRTVADFVVAFAAVAVLQPPKRTDRTGRARATAFFMRTRVTDVVLASEVWGQWWRFGMGEPSCPLNFRRRATTAQYSSTSQGYQQQTVVRYTLYCRGFGVNVLGKRRSSVNARGFRVDGGEGGGANERFCGLEYSPVEVEHIMFHVSYDTSWFHYPHLGSRHVLQSTSTCISQEKTTSK